MASTIEIKKKAKAKFVRCTPSGRRIRLIYDRGVDVLYINFTHSKPEKADYGKRRGDYILRFKENELVGVTVLNAEKHSQLAFSDFSPSRLF
jgi:uncharacterized protein YuzE